MFRRLIGLATVLFIGSVYPTCSLRAETVELVNGDIVHGKVISLDASVLKLRSESFGELSIKRETVATIHLSDARPRVSQSPSIGGEKPQVVPERAESPDDVLKQLRAAGGISAKDTETLRQEFPLLATPEVTGFVGERLSGLLTGKLNLQDIRKEAIDAVDQIKDIQKDLGPQAGALSGYLSILEGFIKETEPKEKGKVDAEPDKEK